MSPTHIKKTVTKESVLATAKWGLVLLSGAIVAAQAMTLGELQGEALIGRSLDIRIPVQSGAEDALSEGCVRADVYYGEAQQAAPRITLQENRLRVQLAEPVNEPVVRVQLRTFCGASQIRSYVLLADLPPDFSANVAVNTPPIAPPTTSEVPGATLAPAAVVLPQAAPVRAAKPVRSVARKQASSVGKSKRIARKPPSTATKRPRDPKPAVVQQAKSVLKLDPLEILSDRMDNLELNMPFVPAEDALLQSRQIATLQAEVKSMRELTVKNDSALLALRSQLEQAQSRQMFTTVLYALIALLLAAVAGLAWLWHSQKKLTVAAQSWWQHASDEDLTAFLRPEVAAPAPKAVAVVTKPLVVTEPEPEPEPAVTTAPSAINPESVQDLRQQAEFFISLGQDHRAIQILSQHVTAAERPNPLICMDLLSLYQQAHQAVEFNQLREVCGEHFNVHLPDLTDALQEGRDLASYPDVLATLTRLWPGDQARLFLDRCIFRKTATQAPFDLAAFRELLSLHTLAEELALPVTPS